MFRFRSKVVWQESVSHILLLSKFKNAREDYREGWLGGHVWEEWEEVLNESPRKAIRRFLKDGALEQASLEGHLAYRFKVPELKAMLKQRGLSVSGRKADLVDRLIQTDPERMKKAVSGLSLLECSSQGQDVVDRYLTHERERRTELEQGVITALHERELGHVARLVNAYDADQVFTEGLSIGGGSGLVIGRDYGLLKTIFTRTPKVLAQLSDEQLEPLRIGAGMLVLGWNVGQVKKWLPSDLETGLQVSNWGAAMMLHSHAHYLKEMQQAHSYDKDGWFQPEVTIQTCNDDHVCKACKRMASRKYTASEVPELPYEKCTYEDGCRCSVSVVPVVPE